MRSGILCCMFPHEERALVFSTVYFPRIERALVFFNCSACGTRPSILCYMFYDFLFIFCCIILSFSFFEFSISTHSKLSPIYALWYCVISCCIFHVWNVLWYFVFSFDGFLCVEQALVFWNFLLYVSAFVVFVLYACC